MALQQNREIAREVLAVSLHVADASDFNLEHTKQRLEQLTQFVLKSALGRKDKKGVQQLDLEFKQIDNLRDLMPQLQNCSNLKELILHGNRLSELPEDLSMLNTVESLDISNNLFDNLLPVVDSLKTMPRLLHLCINITAEADEQYVIDQLPNLLTLNHKRIRFYDAIDSERPSGRLSERSQVGSEATFDQEDLINVENVFGSICNLRNEDNESQKEQGLDAHVKKVMKDFQNKVNQTQTHHHLNTHILKAKFDLYEICFTELIDYFTKHDNRLPEILQTLQLEHANIFNDMANIVYNLRDYKKISKESECLNELDIVKQENVDLLLKQQSHLEEINRMANILQQIEQETSSNHSTLQNQLKVELDQYNKQKELIANNLNDKLQQSEQRIIEMQKLQADSENTQKLQAAEVSQLQLQIQQYQQLTLTTQQQLSESQQQEQNRQIQLVQLQTQLHQYEVQIEKQNESLEQSIQQIEQYEFNKLQQAAISARQDIDQPIIVEYIVQSTQTPQKLSVDQYQQVDYKSVNTMSVQTDVVDMSRELDELQCYVHQLEQENKKYLELVVRHSKGEKVTMYPQSDVSIKQVQSEQSVIIPERKSHKSVSEMSLLITPSSIRPLSLKQLKDLIIEIYESKVKYDQKCLESKLPRETMEQHMYTSLKQKYGLLNLTIEWVTCIINAVKKYASEDNDITVFAKILKNECDEEFRLVQDQVKNTMKELLKIHLRTKYPHKHQADIKDMLNNKILGKITEEEAMEMLKYMYNESDGNMLMKKFKTLSQQSPKKFEQQLTREQKLHQMMDNGKPKYEYAHLQKVILDYQLKCHEEYLRELLLAFRQVDGDRNGIINELEFRKLMDMPKPQFDQILIQRLLSQLDPYNLQSITLSTLIKLLQNEREGQMCILQYIAV